MTKDGAALLAQVIPVIGLGAGLEIRHVGTQLLEYTKKKPNRLFLMLFRAVFATLATTPVILGAAEIKVVLTAIGGGWGDAQPFIVATMFVFSVPAAYGFAYHRRSFQESYPDSAVSLIWRFFIPHIVIAAAGAIGGYALA